MSANSALKKGEQTLSTEDQYMAGLQLLPQEKKGPKIHLLRGRRRRHTFPLMLHKYCRWVSANA